ncbi:MAG: hypothetical protein ITD33_00160 [Nitrosarchaeum sp.]|nr:hypothetical protein [Nitrosarchaeum sp.]
MTRIFIEDNELDIDKGLSNNITYAIDDLERLDSKATSFSKTIVIPGTTRNNTLLGNIFNFNNSNFTSSLTANVNYNFDASRSAKCRIEVNGLQIVKGIFRLMEIVYNEGQIEYECAVFGELGGFFSKLGNSRLEDIDFSAYNHTYSIANITGSWANDNAGEGYIYPHIDYGSYSTAKLHWKYGTFRPALFVRQYLDKIITNSGYTYTFALGDTDRFKRMIIPHNQKLFSRSSSNFVEAYSSNAPTILSGDGINPPDDKSYIPLTTAVVTSNITDYHTTGSFNYNGTPSVVVNITMDCEIDVTTDTRQLFYIGFKNAVTDDYSTSQFLEYASLPAEGTNSNENYRFTITKQVTLNTNDSINLYACTDQPVGSSQIFDFAIRVHQFSIVSTVAVLSTAAIGDTVTINDAIPKNIFQRDFFASMLKLFNLYVTEDKFIEKHLIITPYVDFYDSTPSSYIDWSNKIDRSKQIRMKPMSEVNSRFYNFKFKQDNDFYGEQYRKRYNENYGDRIFDNQLEFSKDTETIELIFASSVLVGYSGEDKIYSTIFKSSNAVEENIDSIIRIMQCKKITGVTSWNILATNGSTILNTGTDYCYAGHFDDPDAPSNDLNFGIPKELFFVLVSGDISVNQFNVYYSSYMAEISDKDSRLLQCMVKLNEQEIYDLDFSKYIYIDGGIYRLQKLIDYLPGENMTTKTELLRVIYTTY